MDIVKHLESRGVDLAKTKVLVDEEANVATFLLFNLSGQLVGYQFYNPQGSKKVNQRKYAFDKNLFKYFTWITKGAKDKAVLAVWGLESLNYNDPILFITEGVFDAIKVQNAGFPAVALLTNAGNNDIRRWLAMLPQKIVAILDNDENDSGEKLKGSADLSFHPPKEYGDLGDMPQSEVNLFLKKIVRRR